MKIAVLDIETTGFNPQLDCIVEMGIVELCLETGAKKILYHEIIKEDNYGNHFQNAWIFSNSNLTHEEVMVGCPLDIAKIQDIFSRYKLTAYNKNFDFKFLKHRGFNIQELPCPMVVSTPICKIPGNYGHKWPKLAEAADILVENEDNSEKHRGLDDAMKAADIVFKLYEMGHYEI